MGLIGNKKSLLDDCCGSSNDKFATSVSLNGTNLVITMNDGEELTQDLSGFIEGSNVTGFSYNPVTFELTITTDEPNSFTENLGSLINIDTIFYLKSSAIMQLRLGAAVVSSSTAIHHTYGQTVWVDLVNGSDTGPNAGAVGRIDCPFATPHAARIALGTGSEQKHMMISDGTIEYHSAGHPSPPAGSIEDDGAMYWTAHNLHIECGSVKLVHNGDGTPGSSAVGSKFFQHPNPPAATFLKLSGLLDYQDDRGASVLPTGFTPMDLAVRNVDELDMYFFRYQGPRLRASRYSRCKVHFGRADFTTDALVLDNNAVVAPQNAYFHLRIDKGSASGASTGWVFRHAGAVASTFPDKSTCIIEVSNFTYTTSVRGVFELRRLKEDSTLKIVTRNMRQSDATVSAGTTQPFIELVDCKGHFDVDCQDCDHIGIPLNVVDAGGGSTPKGNIYLAGQIRPADASTALFMGDSDGALRTKVDLLYDFSSAGAYANAGRDGCFNLEGGSRRSSLSGNIRHIIGTSGIKMWALAGTSTNHCQMTDLTLETDDADLSVNGTGFVSTPNVYIKNVDANVNTPAVPAPVNYIVRVIEVDADVQAAV